MTTSQHTVQLAALLTGCRDATVAAVAGVPFSTWASTSSPRVIPGDKAGYVLGLHRGRLPAIEVFTAPQAWEHQSASGGTIRTAWTLRAHHNGPTWNAADQACRAILQQALAVLRAQAYLSEGSEVFQPLTASPLGFQLECTLETVHTYDRATYELGALPPPDPDGTMPGGTTYLVDITTDPAGVVILNLPSTQALDNVEVEVLEAWNGTGASIAVGKVGTPSAYFAAGDVDVTELGTTETDCDDLGALSVLVTVTPGTGATTGQARIQITTTAKGT